MVDAVSPTTVHPLHVVTLYDGTTRLGFVPVDSGGNPDINGVKRTPIDTQAVKTYSGQSTYDDQQWPYITIAQQDWSGGRAIHALDDDASRYSDGYRADTTKQGKLFLGPQEHWAKGYRNCNIYQPGLIVWEGLYSGGTTSYNVSITASANYNIDYAYIWLRKVGAPTGNVTVSVTNNSTTVTKTYDVTGLTTAYVSQEVKFDWTGYAAWTVAGGPYTLTVTYTDGDASNYVQVMCDGSSDPYYRIYDTDAFYPVRFFEYKSGLYAYTIPTTGNSALYINGDRGTADANTGALTTLIDGSKSALWVVNEWANSIVLLTAGTGATEEQPWRTISSNTTTALTVSPSWVIEHDTTTEYVILKSDKWTSLSSDLGGLVRDHAVDDDYVYFCFGESVGIKRYQYYTSGGAWSTRNDSEVHAARNMTFLRNHNDGKLMMYGSFHNNANFGTGIISGEIPKAWGDLIYILDTVDDTNHPWDESSIANATQSVNQNYTRITLASGFTTGLAATRDITSTDFTTAKRVGFLIKCSIAVNSGDLEFVYDETAACASPLENLDIPALTANTWTWVNLSLTPAAAASAVISIGINVTLADIAACTIDIRGGINLMDDALYTSIANLPSEITITRLINYAGNASDPVENPWIFTETGVMELQTQNGNAIVPLPIGELRALRSELNGKATCVNDVYLWFNLGRTIQKYYNRNLDSTGPDLDEGLPDYRIGDPTFLLSYPGRVFLGIDAGAYSGSAGSGGQGNGQGVYSSILVHRNSGWHEYYRPSQPGRGINSAYYQAIPGSSTGRLWVSEYKDILWLPVALNPLDDPDYTFTHEGHMETGWIYANMRNIQKQFRALTLFLDDPVASYEYVQADYKLDADSSWTAITGDFDAAIEKINLSAASPPNVAGKRIKFRLRLYGRGTTKSPVVRAMILDAYGVAPVKYRYSFSGILHDKSNRPNLEGTTELTLGAYAAVETATAQLQTWIDAGTPLVYNDIHSPFDSKTVIMDPVPLQPLKTDPLQQIEEHIYFLQLSEI